MRWRNKDVSFSKNIKDRSVFFVNSSKLKKEDAMLKFQIEKNITIGQSENGMHWAEIKDDDGTLDMVLLASTQSELFKKIEESKIK